MTAVFLICFHGKTVDRVEPFRHERAIRFESRLVHFQTSTPSLPSIRYLSDSIRKSLLKQTGKAGSGNCGYNLFTTHGGREPIRGSLPLR